MILSTESMYASLNLSNNYVQCRHKLTCDLPCICRSTWYNCHRLLYTCTIDLYVDVRPMEHLTYMSYVHENQKGNNVQCVLNVRVTYLVYVVLCDKIVIGMYIDVQLRSMATYVQWNIWRTFNMYLEIKMATMFSAVINDRLTSHVYEVTPGQITIWKCWQISVIYICPDLKKLKKPIT